MRSAQIRVMSKMRPNFAIFTTVIIRRMAVEISWSIIVASPTIERRQQNFMGVLCATAENGGLTKKDKSTSVKLNAFRVTLGCPISLHVDRAQRMPDWSIVYSKKTHEVFLSPCHLCLGTLNAPSFSRSCCIECILLLLLFCSVVSNPVSYTHLTLPTKRIV